MLSKVLIDNKIFANCFIGGNYPLKNFESKNGVAIAEVCEFNKNIGDIKTDFSIFLKVDNDHLYIYGSLDNLKGYFFDYLDRSKLKFLNADDKILSLYKSDNIISFSIDATSDYKADNLVENNGRYSFDVFERGIFKTRLTLGVLGKHNVYNALSVISISREVFKLDYDKIIKPLCDFSGVERRFQNIGELLDKQIICDYAHHPTELGYTIKTAKELLENDYLIVFQPHTYSRTKLLFNDFIRVLKGENLVIYKEYPSREEYSFEGSSLRLAGELGCEYIDNFESLKEKIGKATVKTVLIIGAGDLYDKVLGEIKNG
ncbi:MAG: hypothetical protein J6V66_06145, partial [Clostridia bacterium]|nr:hypothetical protein [Clostridia bacterium]